MEWVIEVIFWISLTIKSFKIKTGFQTVSALGSVLRKKAKRGRKSRKKYVMPILSNFCQLLIMVWGPCHLNSLALKCQGNTTKGPLRKLTFRCYSVHLLQRSLVNTIFTNFNPRFISHLLRFKVIYQENSWGFSCCRMLWGVQKSQTKGHTTVIIVSASRPLG